MEGQGILSYVKKVIHSLIISTPLRMTVEQLKRDYISEEGSALPFNRLGFKDIESFLRSIPDTVSLVGCGPMAQVLAQKNGKSAHIQSLVQFQKKPSAKTRKQNWLRYPSERSDLVFVNEKFNSRSLNNNQCRRSYRFGGRQNPRQVKPTTSITSSFDKITIANVDDVSDGELKNFEVYCPDEKEDVKHNANNLDKNPIAAYHTEYQSSDEVSDEDVIPSYAVDEQVLSYQYSKDINHNRVIDEKPQIKTDLVDPKKEPIVDYASDGEEGEAIPASVVDARVLSVDYPKDAVRFDYQLPVRDINKKFKLDARIHVQLVTVASPHSFYFWIHDEEYDKYKLMSDNMQYYYLNIDNKRYTIPMSLIMPGHLAAIHYRGVIWQRVRVLAIKTGSRQSIEVEHIDTGERMWICHTELKYLCKDFATLPAQCLNGRLAHIRPRQGANFSVDASNYFYDLVCYRSLYAKVEKLNNADNVVYMILVDPNAESHFMNINRRLVESGWVRRCYNP